MIHSENVNKLLSSVRTPDDGYRALAMAVIIQAADDYRKAKLTRDVIRMDSIARFFHSPLFDFLSRGMNGDYILRRLKEEDTASLRRQYGTYHLGGDE